MPEPGSTINAARTVGRVRSVDEGSVTILTPSGKSQRLTTTESTKVFVAVPGSAEDVVEGSRLVVKYHADSPVSAQEIIVLPPDDVYGHPVVAVDEEHWATVKNFGAESDVYLGYSSVHTVSPATLDDLAADTIVFGMLEGTIGDLTAVQLVVLPDSTVFGS